jgi:hypothetical protein
MTPACMDQRINELPLPQAPVDPARFRARAAAATTRAAAVVAHETERQGTRGID